MPNWTNEQIRAFTERGTNLLVSAAAGSGKTAVLSERVLKFVTDGGDLSRLLIVTFTNAAAEEMKSRIADKIREATEHDPKNAHLRRQYLTLYKVRICTIDSYSIDLVRQNFAALGIAPDFGIMDETEWKILASDLIKEELENCFREFPDGFEELLEISKDETESKNTEGLLTDLLSYARSVPFADEWIAGLSANYSDTDRWIREAVRLYLPDFEEYAQIFSEALAQKALSDKGLDLLRQDLDIAVSIRDCLRAGNWDGAVKIAQTSREFPPLKGGDQKSPAYLRYHAARDRMKKFLSGTPLQMTTALCEEDLKRSAPAVRILYALTLRLRTRLREKMYRKNRYTFDTLAEFALKLTVSEYSHETGTYVPSDIARREWEKYAEVLIDEYQDVNDVQDLFFRSISEGKCFAVGDLKQSIYGFRGSNPDNFRRKREEDPTVALNMNFRSREGILGLTNFFCRGLFSPRFGGTEYDRDEALNPGPEAGNRPSCPYPEKYAEQTEALSDGTVPVRADPSPDAEIFSVSADSQKPAQDLARVTARLIRDAVEGGATVRDAKNNTVRPMRYSDIAILDLRWNHLNVFREELTRFGIPVEEARENFLETAEVRGMLALLRALDNPRKDLSLFVTLTGSAFRLTEDQTAAIRLCAGKKAPLFDGMERAAKDDPAVGDALKKLLHLRILAENLPVPQLIWEIFSTTDYPALENAVSPNARTNLMKFYAFARSYTRADGLSGFLNFAEKAAEKGVPDPTETGGDFVRLNTVFGSKGLEYPWCILPALTQRENNSEPEIDRTLGLAVPIADRAALYYRQTLPQLVICRKLNDGRNAENLRKFYVALTRPKERLTLLIPVLKGKNICPENCGPDGKIYPSVLRDIKDFPPLIRARLPYHPGAFAFHHPIICPKQDENTLPVRTACLTVPEEETRETARETVSCGLPVEELRRRFGYEYDAHLTGIPAKVSVTEIAKLPAEPGCALLLEMPPVARPRFLSGSLTAAEAGTAMHAYCQFADLSKTPDEEIPVLVAAGHLTDEEANVLDRGALNAFLQSDLAERIRNADGFEREIRFTCRIPVSYFSGKPTDSGRMLMQGAIDLMYETPDGYFIVDFKTDKADETELLSRYARQVNLYVTAVEQLYDKPVLGASVWAFRLKKEIPVPKGEM